MGNTNDEGIVEEDFNVDVDEDNTDWKAEAKKQEGIAKRNATKLAKLKEKAEAEPEKPKPSEGLDYGQKAFLIANGVKGEAENKLVAEYLSSGKTLDEIVDNKHFKNDLKDLREAKAVKDATPANSKRSATSTKSTVDYWLAKGELPPADQQELRRDVVNAKIKKETAESKFTSNPVVS
ncbi:MAG: hypothetical protein DRJ64_02680 [Thermoprotei archaeon]|nr:MAG: hypothetical protein DRJ64_02680 [Thermoprotei archaeon]